MTRRPDARRGAIAAALGARRVAVVGASESSRWSHLVHETATAYGFPHELVLVNRSGARAHGRPTASSCAAIGDRIDAALVLVGREHVPEALHDAAAAGAAAAVVLASGYGEAGDDGEAAQRLLAELGAELGLTLFGPNCLGFVNFLDRTAAWAAPPPTLSADIGSIALVSQSGAIAVQAGRFAFKRSIRFSHVVSTGNEAAVGALDVADALVDDERVRCFALFVETIADVPRFDAFTLRAAELDKPVVMLKPGRSALAASVIATHTGALAGDDRIVAAALRQAGVIRVESLEDLIMTAGLLASVGRRRGGKLGVVSISGGACDLVADAAAAAGTPLAVLTDETALRLRGAPGLPAHNPYDVTGAAVAGAELMSDAVLAVADDPEVAIVAVVDVLPDGLTVPEPSKRLAVLGEAFRSASVPCILVHQVMQDIPPALAAELDAMGIEVRICGIDHAVRCLGALLGPPLSPSTGSGVAPSDASAVDASTELEALRLLEQHGVPIVPVVVAKTEDDALAAARRFGHPVVLKLSSPDVLHKTEVGGVALDLRDDDDVRNAFAAVTTGAAECGARVEGVLVAPMRRGGIELIAGIVRDPAWGLVLAVGLGGVWVDVLDDSSLRRLPVDADEVGRMLRELRGAAVLAGVRGGAAADVAQIGAAVAALARLAHRLGPRLESLEVNPLWVDGDRVEALDAAITWS
jgi:acyl-CoA synthetase (NDP forming)